MVKNRRFFLALVAILLTSLAGVIAQEQQYRTPLIEIFSSSTCPPCKPAADHYNPVLDDNKDLAVAIKYSQSWPGTGDPYFTDEGGARRSYYSVNSVPSVFANGGGISAYDITDNNISNWNSDLASVRIKVNYMIDADNKTVKIVGEARAMEQIDEAMRIYIAIVERVTYNNIKTNGETEFHNILKKMVPDQNGISYYQGMELWEAADLDQDYVFQGEYRLPPNATDPIDHDTENSIEDYENLHVVVWAQEIITKDVLQAVNGNAVETEEELPITFSQNDWFNSVETAEANKGMLVYPNPMTNEANILFHNTDAQNVSVTMTNLLGAQVAFENYGVLAGGEQQLQLSTAELPAGVYFLNVQMGEEISSQKVTVTK